VADGWILCKRIHTWKNSDMCLTVYVFWDGGSREDFKGCFVICIKIYWLWKMFTTTNTRHCSERFFGISLKTKQKLKEVKLKTEMLSGWKAYLFIYLILSLHLRSLFSSIRCFFQHCRSYIINFRSQSFS
jgi:hypothetical protein